MSDEIETLSPTESRLFNLIPPPDGEQAERHQKIKDDFGASNQLFETVPQICEGDIRKSLIIEAKRRKYWSTKDIGKMTFGEIEHSCCYHYMLESFTEMRSIAESIESSSTSSHHPPANRIMNLKSMPYSSNSEYAVNPWDFDVQPDVEFTDQTKILELPSTHKMVGCYLCNGEGSSHCFHCRGYGNDKCQYCRGTGMKAGVAHPAVYTHPLIGTFPHSDSTRGYPGFGSTIVRPPVGGKDKPYAVGTPVHFMAKAGLPPPGIGQHDLCIFCQGRGISDCTHCKGGGKKFCATCSGSGTIRVSTKLKIMFCTESSDYYTPCEVPEFLLRTAKGELSFVETLPYVLPIKMHPVKEVNEISRKYCSMHLKKFMGTNRVLKQRHCVETIAVAKVRFKLGSKTGYFFVYGNQRLCFVPKSPTRCLIS